MEYMAGLPDKAFDLAIVDPPYGINATAMKMGENKNRGDGFTRGDSTAVKDRKNRLQRLNGGGGTLKNRLLNTSKIDWDFEQPTIDYFIELDRVSKNLIIWGGNYFDLGPSRCFLCWDKCQPWENFSQIELAWTSFDSPAQIFKYSNTGGNPDKMDKIHPTQKPIKLYRWLLTKYAKPGFKILDTHLGSGSSAIAANSMGFDFVGCEIDKHYFDSAMKRFNNAKMQQSLFID